MSFITEEWFKIWRKTDVWFEKWQEFGKFSPEHSKVSKLRLWWVPFIQSRKSMSLEFTEELCVMTMKNDAKFEEELTYYFKIDMRNLTNFDLSTWKSKKIGSLIGSFDQSMYCLSYKSTKELCLMKLKIDAKFEGKWTWVFKNDMRDLANLANLHRLK